MSMRGGGLCEDVRVDRPFPSCSESSRDNPTDPSTP